MAARRPSRRAHGDSDTQRPSLPHAHTSSLQASATGCERVSWRTTTNALHPRGAAHVNMDEGAHGWKVPRQEKGGQVQRGGRCETRKTGTTTPLAHSPPPPLHTRWRHYGLTRTRRAARQEPLNAERFRLAGEPGVLTEFPARAGEGGQRPRWLISKSALQIAAQRTLHPSAVE